MIKYHSFIHSLASMISKRIMGISSLKARLCPGCLQSCFEIYELNKKLNMLIITVCVWIPCVASLFGNHDLTS